MLIQNARYITHVLKSILASVKTYGLSDGDAEKLYKHLWVYSHGIAVLCATNLCSLTVEETGKTLTEVFVGLFKEIRSGGNTNI